MDVFLGPDDDEKERQHDDQIFGERRQPAGKQGFWMIVLAWRVGSLLPVQVAGVYSL